MSRPASSASTTTQVRLSPPPNALANGNSSNSAVNRLSSSSVLQPQLRGFVAGNDMRRRSSGTSTATMTTTTDFSPPPNSRPYATAPVGRQNLAFPTPNPAPRLSRAETGRSVDTSLNSITRTSSSHSAQGHGRVVQSDVGHEDVAKRFSTGTAATFGKWDIGLQSATGPEEHRDVFNSRSPVCGLTLRRCACLL